MAEGLINDSNLDSDGAIYQLPEGAIEDTDRSEDLFRSKSDRNEILNACKFQCFYCYTPLGDDNWEADHIVAVASGGSTILDNGVAACRSCNRKKGRQSHREFIQRYGGKDGISRFVRCHGFSNAFRCKNPECPKSTNYYCHCHQ